MNFIRNIFVFISFAIISLGSLMLLIWAEMSLILPKLNDALTDYGVWLIIGTIVIWIWKVLPFLGDIFAPLYTFKKYHIDSDTEAVKNLKTRSTVKNSNNPPTIIPKPIGGYNREQLNDIYLIGILIHQIYYSNVGNNLSEERQRKALSIQMRFFVTVFPQRNVRDYFDFTEDFMNRMENLYNYSVWDYIERNIQNLSSCNNKQIKKLQNLFGVLANMYLEIGGGNKTTLTTFINLLDAELSNLIVEDDWRSHYAQKKNH